MRAITVPKAARILLPNAAVWLLGGAVLCWAAAASATTQEWNFTDNSCSANCGSGPFGTVEVSDHAGAAQNGLQFAVTLSAPAEIHKTTTVDEHPAFAFDLDYGSVGYSEVSFSSFTLKDPDGKTDPAKVTSTSQTSTPAGFSGTFPLVLSINKNSAQGAILTFTVSPAAKSGIAAFTTSDIARDCPAPEVGCDSRFPFFVSDIFIASKTGNIAVVKPNRAGRAPEPPSSWLLAVALGGFALMRRGRSARPPALI
jgi:hypothetical protein